jgi:hypothetical protein
VSRKGLYAPYATDRGPTTALADLGCWSTPLRRLIVRDRRQADRESMPGKLDFDPFVDGQDWDPREIASLTLAPTGTRQVTATFGRRTVRFQLVVEDGRWKIDDVSTSEWDLRQILGR